MVGEFTDWGFDIDYQFAKISSTQVTINFTAKREHVGKTFVIAHKNNTNIVIDANKLPTNSYFEGTSYQSIKILAEGNYKLSINTSTNALSITKTSDPELYYAVYYGGLSTAKVYKATYNSTGKYYEFSYDAPIWGTIQIHYNGDFISSNTTNVMGAYKNAAGPTYTKELSHPGSGISTVFMCSNASGVNYTFKYYPEADSLNVISDGDEYGLFYSGTHNPKHSTPGAYSDVAVANSDGTYTFSIDFNIWSSISLNLVTKEGTKKITTDNTTVTGYYSTVHSATYTKVLYTDAGVNDTFICSYNGGEDITYTFTYDPKANTLEITAVESIGLSYSGSHGSNHENAGAYNEVLTAQRDSGFTVVETFNLWSNISFVYTDKDGKSTTITTSNTNIIGAFKNGGATWTEDLYTEDGTILTCSYNGSVTYKFIYTPAANANEKGTLEIIVIG